MKRWCYIREECNKRGIRVISHGADGDTRALLGMKISTNFLVKDKSFTDSVRECPIKIPSKWHTWFLLNHPTSICYVQDMVHVGVKLKSRLLKPSIILPLGKYTAGAHHLHLLFQMYNKDQHGLHQKDLDHKDRQNYDAVVRIVNQSTIQLLKQITDALGTMYYLQVLKTTVDSYLDRKLHPLEGISKIWFAVFFFWYWKHYITKSSAYKIENNFITHNAYVSTELNAHAIVLFLVILRDKKRSDSFMPWLLGSQCCEKAFRTIRSMSSTFSTVINFSMLGMLRRLHKMQIQMKLESETDVSGIFYPNVEAHKKKDGHEQMKSFDLSTISNENIEAAVNKGKQEAQKAMDELGMKEQLSDCWNNPTVSGDTCLNMNDYEDEEDKEEGVLLTDDDVLEEVYDESHFIKTDVGKLKDAEIIDNNLSTEMLKKHSKLEKINSHKLPLYKSTLDDQKNDTTPPTAFLKVEHNGKEIYVRKRTVVWLFTEGERVSNDRLFRVRAIQPFSSNSPASTTSEHQQTPYRSNHVSIGDICAFKKNDGRFRVFCFLFKICKLEQFAYFKEKAKKAQECKQKTVLIAAAANDNIGVLCTWYNRKSNNTFTLEMIDATETGNFGENIEEMDTELHEYHCLSKYVCTLPFGCVDVIPYDDTDNEKRKIN